MDWAFHKKPCNELHVPIVGNRVCGTERSLIDVLYVSLDDGNVKSFCIDV